MGEFVVVKTSLMLKIDRYFPTLSRLHFDRKFKVTFGWALYTRRETAVVLLSARLSAVTAT